MVLLSAVFGAGLLIAADLSTLYEVRVLTVTKASESGHAQHGWALALVGLAALGLAAAATGNRRAMPGVAVLGVAALAVMAVAGDFHDVHATGAVGRLYENATAQPERGFYLETLGAVLLVAGGLGAVVAGRGGVGGRPQRVRPGAGEATEGRTVEQAPAGRSGRAAGEATATRPGRAGGAARESRRARETGTAPATAAAPTPPATPAAPRPRRRRPPPTPAPPPPDPDDWFA